MNWLIWAVSFWIIVLIFDCVEISLSSLVLFLNAPKLYKLLTCIIILGATNELHFRFSVSVLLSFNLSSHEGSLRDSNL
jgi:hypothetical protein